jgi:SOS-response transcriptional repressor LexA
MGDAWRGAEMRGDHTVLRGAIKDHRVASLADLNARPLRRLAKRRCRGVKLGKTCQRVLEFIASCAYSPSLREIGEAVGLSSSSSVQAHVKNLEALGYLEPSVPGKPRSIVLANRPDYLGRALALAQSLASETGREDATTLLDILEKMAGLDPRDGTAESIAEASMPHNSPQKENQS